MTKRTATYLRRSRWRLLGALGALGLCALNAPAPARAADSTSDPALDRPYTVEWVYKVKWGHSDEFFDIFKQYQVKILDRQKQLGDILNYTIYRPGLHTGEDERWDYTVVIVYRNILSSTHEGAVERQLFPDRDALRRDENHRWELVEAHWDLPIRAIDPHEATE